MSSETKKGLLFKWRIENFSFCHQEKDDYLYSSPFLLHKTNGEWWMVLAPRGDDGTENSISLSLVQEHEQEIELVQEQEHDDYNIKLSYEIKLLGPSGKILGRINGENQLFKEELFEMNVDRNLAMQDIEEANQDFLTVNCHIYDIYSHKLKPILYEECTTISINRHLFEWNVRDTDDSFRSSEYISFPKSADFIVELKEIERSLRLFIYRKTKKSSLSHFVQIHLRSLSKKKSISIKATHLFPSECNTDKCWECLIPHKRSDCFISLRCKKIQCEFTCSGRFIPDNTRSRAQQPWRQFTVYDKVTDGFTTLQEDAYNMLCEKKHCDVKLRVSDSVVEAHKSILASRSPVFSTMFELDMTETQTGVVNIPDVDEGTLNSFLKFLYTDKVDDMTYESASNLILVTEKYQVLSLKKRCADFLMSQLKAENACEMLKIADMVCHNELKTLAVDFIVLNSKVIFLLPEWNSWVRNNGELATEIFSKLTENVISS